MLVLLVEDHRLLAETLIDYLENEDIECDYAATGNAGLTLAQENRYDAIVLDVGLPGLSGLDVCRAIRSSGVRDVPILMLTARDELDDKLNGFEAGADDYLVKPFEQRELVARLRAVTNRHRGVWSQPTLGVGDLELDTASYRVTRAGQRIKLSPVGFKLLHLLLRESPAVVSRAAMLNALWGDDLPDTDALRSHLYNLRRAVDQPFDVPMIETVKGVGVRLVPPPTAPR
ncbi:MAG: response regulator transcription factor [Pseudomonadota bacterium]